MHCKHSRVVEARWLEARWLGTVPYPDGAALQQDVIARRRQGALPDQLLLLEHPHVITMGSASDPENILVGPDERRTLGIELAESSRGGDVTYHGPGQLVGYPILDLNPDRRDIHRYLRNLEEVLIRVVEALGGEGFRIPGVTGAWTAEGKVAAIGIRVSSGWITSHGFALNVSTDLGFFERIVPCGLADRQVTSLERVLGREVSMEEVMGLCADKFGEVFDLPVFWVEGLP